MKPFYHNAIFRLCAPAIYGLLVYLMILLINNNVTQVNGLFITEELYVCVFLSYLSFEAIRAVILVVNKILRERSPALVISVQVIASLLISTALVLFCLIAYFKYIIGFSISVTQLTIFGFVYIFTALLYNVLYLSNYYLHKENTLRINAERQQRTVLELEMTEYKNDINPDLLYESLENVIGLMYRDVEKAEEYIDWLGSAYRYVLTNRHNELVTLTEECEAARNIVRLLNEKYSGHLVFETSLTEEDLDAMLIPGSIPLILESLIRNTIIPASQPFVIRCYKDDGYLIIESRLNDRLVMHEASEHAFARLQRSYAIYTDQPLIKVKAYAENYIKLPVIRLMEERINLAE